MMTGLLLAVILYRPIYNEMYALTDVTQKTERTDAQTIQQEASVSASNDTIITTQTVLVFTDGTQHRESVIKSRSTEVQPVVKKEILLSGNAYWWMVTLIIIQIVLVTMVYGPIAAFLVELFPTRIRYTSMSLPYHIGNGVFGGLTPLIATSLYELSKSEQLPAGDPVAGLWYPIVISAMCFIVGMIFLPRKIRADVTE
jgi:MHS family proline/betaine transporter-like MFS transporter